MTRSRLLPLAATLLLAACAGTGDPHDGGFITGITNLANGGYQQRIDQREAQVASLSAEQAQLRAQADAIRQEQAEVDRDLAAARSRLSQLDRRIAALRSRVSAADAARLSDAQKRLQKARLTADEASNPGRPAAARAADVADLQQVLDSVGGLVDDISRTAPPS
jgi:chromosome segregation ATPase